VVGGTTKVFTYPLWMKISFAAMLILQAFVLAYAVLQGDMTLSDLLGFILVLTAVAIGSLALYRAKVTVDDQRLTCQGLRNTVSLDWSEIDDVHYSAPFIILSSAPRKKRITLWRSEYGMSLQPFEVLQQEIYTRTHSRLVNTWKG